MTKIIHRAALRSALKLMDMMDKQLELIEQMRKGGQQRRESLQEFVRANYTGDAKAFQFFRDGMKEHGGAKVVRRYYDNGIVDSMRSKQIERLARAWAATEEETT